MIDRARSLWLASMPADLSRPAACVDVGGRCSRHHACSSDRDDDGSGARMGTPLTQASR